jgi:hypothetical protein
MSTHMIAGVAGWQCCRSGLRSDQTESVARETVNCTVDGKARQACRLNLPRASVALRLTSMR